LILHYDDGDQSEDDEDPETLPIGQIFDLALTKHLAPGQPAVVSPGDDVDYEIEVCNQGTIDAYEVTVVDYLPTGLTLNDGDWLQGTSSTEVFTIYDGVLLAGQCDIITITLTVDANFTGEATNFAEIAGAEDDEGNPQDDVDSTPDTDNSNDGPVEDDVNDNSNGDEDDHDPATVTSAVFDLALGKDIDPAQALPVYPGDDLTFAITVTNQGSVDAYSVEVTDYLPTGTTLNDANWIDNGDGTAVTGAPIAFIASGNSVTLQITVTIDANFNGTEIVNHAEISSADDDTDPNNEPPTDTDSTPDAEQDNGDEDDDDGVSVPLSTFDLALTKQLAPGQSANVNPGDDVTFAITVYNQGAVTAQNVLVTDYIPTGLILNDLDWTSTSLTSATNVVPGPIAPGSSIVVYITFTVDASFGSGSIVNFAEISDAEDEYGNHPQDSDSTPDSDPNNDGPYDDDSTDGTNGDEDDHDPAEIFVEEFDLALEKVLISSGPFYPGSDVTYLVTVFNQGSVDAYNIEVVDYIPNGMILNDTNWTLSVNNQAYTTIAGPIVAGGSATVMVTMTIDPNAASSGSLTNYAEISSAEDENGEPRDDIDSTPDDDNGNDGPVTDGETNNGNGDEDDHDPATVEYEVFDLALMKVVSPSVELPVFAGDDVDFIITVFNQGTVDAYNVDVIDYLPAGYSLNDSDWILDANGNAVITVPGPVTAGSSIDIPITVTILPGATSEDLVNYAEITDAEDENGNHPEDIDSTPDGDDGNDNNVDDVTDGSGGDEDDHDGAGLPVEGFDLALSKVLSDPVAGPVGIGDQVTFTITVYNQGSVSAYNMQITDYIPADLTLADSDWLQVGADAQITLAGPLASGASTNVDITFTVSSLPADGIIYNYAEISDAQDENGDSPTDVDSTADSDGNNDGTVEDDEIYNANGDEDDHDVASIGTGEFDLALSKQLAPGQASSVSPGDDVTFVINVYNQGTIDAYNVQVVDYIPADMMLNDANWSLSFDGTAFTTIPGPIAGGTSTSVTITCTVDPSFTSGDLTNYAEIASAEDENGEEQDDVDSTPDSTDNNDGLVTDDAIDGENGDEDDHDPAVVSVDVFDLALTKSLAPGQTGPFAIGDAVTFTVTVYNQGTVTAQNVEVVDYVPNGLTLTDADWALVGGSAFTTIAGPITAGSSMSVDITFTINANATGTSIENYAEIASAEDDNGNPRDDIDSTPDSNDSNDGPVSDDVTDGNNGDEDDHDVASIGLQEPIFDLALSKTLAPGQSNTVFPGALVSFEVTVYNQGEITATNIEVIDYMPGDTFLADPNWTLGPNNTARTTIPGPLAPGTSTTVSITVEIDDDFVGPMVNWAEISDAYDEDGNSVDDIDSTPDDSNSNDAGGQPDSPADNATSGNGTGSPGDSDAIGDEDDHDPASLNVIPMPVDDVFDLALTKVLAAGQSSVVAAGDLVTYTITVFNQGNVTAQNVQVIDYLPAGLTLADADWTSSTNNTALFTLAGPIAAGASVTVDITVMINPGQAAGDYTNFAEIVSAENTNGVIQPDVDSTPDNIDDNDGSSVDNATDSSNGDEDDHDPAVVTVAEENTAVADLALNKTLAVGQNTTVAPGSFVTYTITVFNQGNVTATDIEVVDYLPSNMTLADANWFMGAAGNAYTSISGPLTPGGSVAVNITVQLSDNAASGDLINYAEISQAYDANGDVMVDIDSNPDDSAGNDAGGEPGSAADNSVSGNGTGSPGDGISFSDEDDHDPAMLTVLSQPVPEFDLALVKTLAAGQNATVQAGDQVTFEITVYNQGGVDAANVSVADYIPAGLSLNDSDWTLAGNLATTTLSGTIAAGASSSVEITMDVTSGFTGAVQNFAEITDATDSNGNPVTDIDSTPDSNPNNDGAASDNVTNNANGDEDDHDFAGLNIVSEPVGECTTPTDCGSVDLCVEPITPNTICPDFCENGNFTITSLTSTFECALMPINNGTCFMYTPLPGMADIGFDFVTVEAEDANGNCVTLTYNISIGGCNENSPPVITTEPAEYCGQPMSAMTICVDAYDSDLDDVAICDLATISDCNINSISDLCFVYVPLPLQEGVDVITITVCDEEGLTDTVEMTVTVGCVAPTGINDVLNVDLDGATVNGSSVSVNNNAVVFDPSDNDQSNDACITDLEVTSIVSGPSNGQAMVVNGTVQYEANEGFTGTDEIVYEVCNSCGACDVATISITADLEVCVTTLETCTEPLTQIEVCVDFCNINNAEVVSANTLFNCSVTLLGANCFSYVPLPALTGIDSVSVLGMNAAGETDMAVVYIDVDGCDGFLIAEDDEIITMENESVTFNALANDESNSLLTEPTIDVNPSFGDAAVNLDGTITYMPTSSYYGIDVFTYKTCDAYGNCDDATVFVTVMEVVSYSPVVANNDQITIDQNETATINALSNDYSILGSELTLVWVSESANAITSFNNQTIVYNPEELFFGVETLEYMVCDEFGTCVTAQIEINVTEAEEVVEVVGIEEDIASTFNIQTALSTIGGTSVQFEYFRNQELNITLVDLAGKVYATTTTNAINGINNVELEHFKLSAGIYIINITDSESIRNHKYVVR